MSDSNGYPRIIRPGKEMPEKVYKHVCIACRAMFEFKRENTSPLHDISNQGMGIIDCPSCNSACFFKY